MSILKKNALAIALVAGLGLAGSAGAYNLFTSGDTAPVMVATADIASNATPIGIDETFDIDLTAGDFILGRTTGFTVRYNLATGTFADPITTADITNVGPNSSWVISVIAGGNIGDNFLVIKLDPAAVPVGLVPGNLLSINAALAVVAPPPGTGQILDNLAALQTSGATVVANLLFVDPVTSAQILPSGSLVILQSGDPVVQDCDPNTGDIAKKIDVGVTPTNPNPKTAFSPTGEIGAVTPPQDDYMNVGAISATVDPTFPSFAYQLTDAFHTVVTGDFSTFALPGNSVTLSSTADCLSTVDTGTVSGNTVTFDYTNGSVGGGAGGFTVFVCANAPGNTTVIDATNVSETTTFTRGTTVSNGASCDLLPLQYNGSVVQVYVINPDGNMTAQSFIRVINPSNGVGKVTIDGTDDSGNASASSISFTLGAGQSMQLNSSDLENGNAAKGLVGAWGNGAGKWRAVVTGEFAGMRVQSLNRNYTDGTVTNLTDADGKGEQSFEALFDN